MSNAGGAHESLVQLVADAYRAKGFSVVVEPDPSSVPFELGGYRPDLIARKGENDAFIIEVKAATERASYERLRPVIEETKRHEGWHFVFITNRDVLGTDLEQVPQSSWEEIEEGIKQAGALEALCANEAAYLMLWIAFERTLRNLSLEMNLPLDRLSPAVMIRQLYSEGGLTVQQFDTALSCLNLRHSVAHGYRASNVVEGYQQLRDLMGQLLSERMQDMEQKGAS